MNLEKYMRKKSKSYLINFKDINKINNFLEYWNDFIDEKINQFNESPISFCVEKLK